MHVLGQENARLGQNVNNGFGGAVETLSGAAGRWMTAIAFGFACLLLGGAVPAHAELPPPPAGNGVVVEDVANVLSPDAGSEIASILGALLEDGMPPVVVVTVHSLGGQRIEAYASQLFDTWGIGQKIRNRGVLLLVALGDRKARIELGAGWGGGEHFTSRQIMDSHIVPAFRRGDFDTGVLDGVRAIDAMIRAEPMPRPTRPWWFWPTLVLFFAAVVAIAVSLFRSGRTGWGWAFLIAVGAFLFLVLRCAPRRGSFGGGFSGGGGVTGSW